MQLFAARPPGSMIFLHGASSSGKSTLAKALQQAIDIPFWHISIDHLREAGVLPLARVKAGEFNWAAMRAPFFDGYHRSLAAYLESGNNLIVEHILEAPDWRPQLAPLFAPFDLFFVAVHCSLDELNRREAARGDRPAGSAARDLAQIHVGHRYDLELDGEADTAENVARLIEAWQNRRPQSRFFDA